MLASILVSFITAPTLLVLGASLPLNLTLLEERQSVTMPDDMFDVTMYGRYDCQGPTVGLQIEGGDVECNKIHTNNVYSVRVNFWPDNRSRTLQVSIHENDDCTAVTAAWVIPKGYSTCINARRDEGDRPILSWDAERNV